MTRASIWRGSRISSGTGIALEYSDRTGGAEGMSLGGRIVLKAGLGPATEFAFFRTSWPTNSCTETLNPGQRAKTVRETEAEAVAFVVCQAVGLDTSTAPSRLHPTLPG